MSLYQPVRRPPRKRMSEINVVPYIDVMLVLLVIFMITAPLLSQGVKVDLPQAEARQIDSKQEEPLIVSIDRDGRYYLNLGDKPDRPIKEQKLVSHVMAVLRHRRDNTVYVKGDRKAYYGHIVTVMAMLKQAGVEHVGLVTRMPETDKKK